MTSMWDIVEACEDELDVITKEMFGELVRSLNQEDVDKALKALESAGDYDNLPD